MKSNLVLTSLCPLLVSLALLSPASAQDAKAPNAAATAPLPVKDYARRPEFGFPVLSPDGKHLAVLVPIKEHLNLAVIDLATMKSTLLTSVDFFDVENVIWVGNERLVFTLGQRNSPTGDYFQGGGLFVVQRDGSDARTLVPTLREMVGQLRLRDDAFPDVLATFPGNDKEILVTERRRSDDARDVYRLDVTTGRRTLVTEERPRYAQSYILDRERVPRVAVAGKRDSSEVTVWFRKTERDEWIELLKWDALALGSQANRIIPLGFDDDNTALLVASSEGRDTMAIRRFDPATKTLGETLIAHARYDLGATSRLSVQGGGLIRSRDRRLLGFTVDAERPRTVWADDTMATLQAVVDKALPQRVNWLSPSDDAKRAVVTSFSDRQPPEFLLYDAATKKIEPLVSAMPWLRPEHLAEVRPFLLKTRDGLEIPSYHVLPNGYQPGQKLPTVVHIHGGPAVRADRGMPSWFGGYGMAEAQMLASRGYAVVLPNFRITPGFGAKIFNAGKGSIGRKMSEDHEDAAKWAVEQGFADPARICITGASYGGYATLRALAKTPDLFKCGIAGLVVSDLERQLTSPYGDTRDSEVAQRFWREFVIDVKADPNAARAMSPVHQAASIKAPLFIYAGGSDVRTPIEQTNMMVDALKKAGKEPELLVHGREAHGFGSLDNRTATWERMLAFLSKHIGTGPTPVK